MILWTVMPLELVFSEQEFVSPYEEVDYDGTKLMVERLSPTEGQVVRILSSNPEDFLNPKYQPGTRLSYSLTSAALSS